MYKALGWLNIVTVVMLAALGFAQKADPQDILKRSPLLASFVTNLKDHSWILIPLLTALLLVFKWLRDFVGAPWVKDAIHSILSVLGEFVFAGEDNPETAYDRVTLFRRRGFYICRRRWPWSGWLVPIIRSGHTSQKTSIIFRAPDTPSKAEGIAGYCWANQKQLEINGLPHLTNASPEADYAAYADATKMSAEWVSENLPQARSYFAFPLKAKGKP